MKTQPPKMETDTVLTPPEQNTKPRITPGLVIVSTMGRSPAQAESLVNLMGQDAEKLPALYAAKNLAEIRKLVNAAKTNYKTPAKPPAKTAAN